MKKLWIVTYEAKNVIYCETHEEAVALGRKYQREVHSGLEVSTTYEMGKLLPDGWEEDCVPYNEDELSIKDIWALPVEDT